LLGFVQHPLAQGTLILGHFGSANPTNEGFSLFTYGASSLTPVMNDYGYNAWSIGVSSPNAVAEYYQSLTSEQSDALSDGWVLSLTLRVVQPCNPVYSGIEAGFGGAGVGLDFGALSDGDPAVWLENTLTEYDFNGGGSGYHNYQLRYDAPTGLVSLWVDGTEWLNDIPINSNDVGPDLEVVWGENQSASIYANWSEVSLWATPEPSGISLFLLGGGVLICVRRRKQAVRC